MPSFDIVRASTRGLSASFTAVFAIFSRAAQVEGIGNRSKTFPEWIAVTPKCC